MYYVMFSSCRNTLFLESDCKIKPSNILFIDDCSDNIETAKKRGWNTCLASGYELNKIKNSINKFLNLK